MLDVVFPDQEVLDHVLVALRRIVRAIDLHSKKLVQSHHLTIPQVVLLKEIQRHAHISLGDLARNASLSNATITGIVDRLEARNLVRRVRSKADRRQVFVEINSAGDEVLRTTPPLLQERFIHELQGLQAWEQAQILSSLERVASIMDAGTVSAAPILAHHPLAASEDHIHLGESLSGNPNRHQSSKSAAASSSTGQNQKPHPVPAIRLVRSPDEFPPGVDIAGLTEFLHENLKPFEDTPEDIERGIRDALSARERKGGFILIATCRRKLLGALVMQRTGMKGYVPENILLFVAVAPEQRNRGLGQLLVERAVRHAEGSIKLHVEYINPARRLYERLGFTSKYAEMRYAR